MTTNVALQSFENWSLLPPELRCLVVDKMDDQTLVNFAITCKENYYKIAKKRLEELNKPIVDNCKFYEESPKAPLAGNPNYTFIFVDTNTGVFYTLDNPPRSEPLVFFTLDKCKNSKENLENSSYYNQNQDSFDLLGKKAQKMFNKVIDSVSKKYSGAYAYVSRCNIL